MLLVMGGDILSRLHLALRLDGREGFLLAVAGAEGSYYRYMKAWFSERQRG